jgi:hypothetical protein
MTQTIISIEDGNGGEFGSVVWVDEWAAYDWRSASYPNGGTGPYDTAEEAGEALADELEPFKLGGAIDLMLGDCRRHDAEAA